jgi:hypothetical protein
MKSSSYPLLSSVIARGAVWAGRQRKRGRKNLNLQFKLQVQAPPTPLTVLSQGNTMSFLEKAVNPSFYKKKWASTSHNIAEYYKPLFRAGR